MSARVPVLSRASEYINFRRWRDHVGSRLRVSHLCDVHCKATNSDEDAIVESSASLEPIHHDSEGKEIRYSETILRESFKDIVSCLSCMWL